MQVSHHAKRIVATALASAALSAAAAGATAAGPDQRVRGTVSAVESNRLIVRTSAGQDVNIALTPDYKVLLYRPVALQDVPPNAYVAVASAPQGDGSLQALAIVVFPDAMRGMNEGTKAWDLTPSSRMTNATVAQFVGTSGPRAMKLRFGDQEQTIAVTERTAVATFGPAERSELAAGVRTVVFATRGADGTIQAGFVGVGRDGYMPPL